MAKNAVEDTATLARNTHELLPSAKYFNDLDTQSLNYCVFSLDTKIEEKERERERERERKRSAIYFILK